MNYYSSSTRVFFGGPVTRTVKQLIIINAAVYLLLKISELLHNDFILAYFALIPIRVSREFMIWQLVTYMFMHAEILHLFFNMLTLFMFGNDLERYWGTHRFLRYYFITGIGGGGLSWLLAMNSMSPIIGASGAIYGLLLAYGLLYPNRIVYLNFLLPVKVKWLVIIMGGINLFYSLTGGEPGVAHIAHLGGLLVGLVYLKGPEYLGRFQTYRSNRRREQLKQQFEVYYGEMRRKMEKEKKGPTIH